MALPPIHVPPEIQALRWYPLGIAHEVELLHRYINDIEAQVVRGIENFRKGVEHYERPGFGPDDLERIPYFGEVDGGMWDLETVFVDYFPNLQRGSAAITLFAFFENEMNSLCRLLQKIEGIKVAPKDLQGEGIERSTSYLKLIIGIDPCKNTSEWAEILGIREFRNNWVHAAGRLPQPAPNEQSRIAKYVDSSAFLETEGRNIKINTGFLGHVLSTFDRYLSLINSSLQAKYKPK